MASSSWEISCAEHRAEQFLPRPPPRRMILLKIPPLTLQVAERLVEVAWLIQPDDPASPWWGHPQPGNSSAGVSPAVVWGILPAHLQDEQHAMMRSLTPISTYPLSRLCRNCKRQDRDVYQGTTSELVEKAGFLVIPIPQSGRGIPFVPIASLPATLQSLDLLGIPRCSAPRNDKFKRHDDAPAFRTLHVCVLLILLLLPQF